MEKEKKTGEATGETTNVSMVEITVLKPFRDKYNDSVIYQQGQELEFESLRAKDVVERGLAEYKLPEG